MAVVIPLQLEGEDALRSGFKAIAANVREFRDELAKLRQVLGKPLPSPNSRGGGGNNASSQVQKLGQAAQQARGPVANLQRAYQQLQHASASGDPGQQFDAMYNMHLASKRYNRAHKAMQPPSAWSAAKDALMTSRVGLGGGGGLMPLVNRLMPILRMAGPIGAAAAGIVVAISLFKRAVEALDQVTRSQQQFATARYAAGASYAQTTQMAAIGGAVGLDAGQVAQAARQFSEAIGSGGWAAGQWRQHGISDIAGPYGKVNKADNLLRALEVLQRMPERDAIRLARESNLEQFLPLRDASPGALRDLMSMQSKLLTPESARAAADFQVALTRLRLEMQAMLPHITPVVNFFGTLVGQLRVAAEWAGRFLSVWMNTWQAVGALVRGDISGAQRHARAANRAMTGNTERSVADAARDRNTEALNDNTRELRRSREIIGGGQRARNAIPGSWRYNNINRQLDSMASALGAF